MHKNVFRAVIGATALTLTLGSCGGSDNSGGSSPTDTGNPAAETALTLDDGWAKAVDKGMSGVFGTLRNDSDKPVVLTAVSSTSAGVSEFHIMKKDSSGVEQMTATDTFEVPANGTFALKPGGKHIMLMKLKDPLEVGDEVDVTIDVRNGQQIDLTVPVRAFEGAEEEYADTSGSADHDDQS